MGFSYLRPDQVDRSTAALLEGLKTIGEEADPADLFDIDGSTSLSGSREGT